MLVAPFAAGSSMRDGVATYLAGMAVGVFSSVDWRLRAARQPFLKLNQG
jgi:hypothetical protein